MVGKRERVDCPEKGCKMSQVEGGIDVRGLKAHLISKHGYNGQQAASAWEQATGRKSRGRPAKRRAIEYVERDPIATAGQPSHGSNGSGDPTAWFQKGFEAGIAFGRKMAKE